MTDEIVLLFYLLFIYVLFDVSDSDCFAVGIMFWHSYMSFFLVYRNSFSFLTRA